MKKTSLFLRRSMALLLALVMVVGLLPALSLPAKAAANGNCGAATNPGGASSVTWTLVDGVLTIEGTGAMEDWGRSNMPWSSSRNRITSVVIKDGVTDIGNSAFYKCSYLTSITLPEGLTTIGASAFSSCSKLTSITLPEGVITIGERAFYNCTALTSITISEGVTTIGERAFYGCTCLKRITLPDSLTTIGNYAFYECSKLTSITLPKGVTSIGSNSFQYCSALTEIIVDEENPAYTAVEGGCSTRQRRSF